MSRIRTANRTNAKPLIGIYSESGNGKTYSSLLLARGFIGPQGKICMIETESGRGEAYADPKEYPEIGGYSVLPLSENFSPQEYGEAISEVEAGGFDALIIDSASHEWEGAGGVLDMAVKNQEAGKKGPIVWQRPKIDHQRHFMLKFMQSSVPLVILNMRAKYPMEQKVVNGKKDWVRSEVLDPKQSEDILFEMFVHGWIDKNHNFNPTKITAKHLETVFQKGRPISLETGKKLAEWASGASKTDDINEFQQENDPTKAKAIAIRHAIANSKNEGDLADIWSMMYADDLDDLKEESQSAYDFLRQEYEKKMASFKGDYR